MTLKPPFLFLYFFTVKFPTQSAKKCVCMVKTRAKILAEFICALHLLPASQTPFFQCADSQSPGKKTPKQIGPYFLCQKIQKLQIFGQKSQKMSQNRPKSRGLRTPCKWHVHTTQCEGRATHDDDRPRTRSSVVRRTIPALHPLPCQPLRPQSRPPHHHRRKPTRPWRRRPLRREGRTRASKGRPGRRGGENGA